MYMEKVFFKDKNCKLVTDNGYVLYGKVTDVDNNGFFFETDETTSYYSWISIRSLVPKE
jgi:hypothetical protein